MIINKYRARNLKEAIQKAKEDLGPDARMIHLRELNDCEEKIEIIAAIDDGMEMKDQVFQQTVYNEDDGNDILSKGKPGNATKRMGRQSAKQTKEAIQGFDMLVDDTSKLIPEEDKKQLRKNGSYQASVYDKTLKTQKLSSQTEQITKANTGKIVKDNRCTIELLHDCCIRNRVDTNITYEILSLVNDDMNAELPETATLRDYLYLFMNRTLRISDGLNLDKKTAIFIGPTGVGKTTTLAKLAAQYHFYWNKSVGLITIDTYRIAAIEQLKTYSQIMAIPLMVALTPKELEAAIKSYDDMDLILIDTPGRSQFNSDALSNLEEFLEAAQPAETHLLMAVTMKDEDAFITLENFAPEHVQKLIFTKLDETSSFGTILNISRKARKPISYLTIGQKVPEDIETAKLERMVDLFIAGGPQ